MCVCVWGGGGNVSTRPNCRPKLFLVAAAPVLQNFHPGEKVCVCGGGGLPPRFLRP